MRRIAIGLLLAAGATLPSLAIAQDQVHHRDGRPAGEHARNWGGRPAGAPQPGQPRPAPALQAGAPMQGGQPMQGGARFGGSRGGQGYARPDGAPGGGYRGQSGQGSFRPDGAAATQGYQPGSDQQGFRPDRTLGDGGYRSQPGQRGFRSPDGRPAIAPGSGGYRAQQGQPGYHGYPGGGYDSGDRGVYRGGNDGGYRSGGYGGGGYHAVAPRPGAGGNWNRGWRDDRRYDFRAYRGQNNLAFHLRPYYAPRGWSFGYRRFSPGITLDAFLFDQGYWIDDPYAYRLPPAWGPYRWVRYYNDALLVDVRSGVVVDAVYGIFW